MAFLQNYHIVVDILSAFSIEGIIQYTASHPLSFNKSCVPTHMCLVNFHVCTHTHTEILPLLPGKALPRISN